MQVSRSSWVRDVLELKKLHDVLKQIHSCTQQFVTIFCIIIIIIIIINVIIIVIIIIIIIIKLQPSANQTEDPSRIVSRWHRQP